MDYCLKEVSFEKSFYFYHLLFLEDTCFQQSLNVPLISASTFTPISLSIGLLFYAKEHRLTGKVTGVPTMTITSLFLSLKFKKFQNIQALTLSEVLGHKNHIVTRI